MASGMHWTCIIRQRDYAANGYAAPFGGRNLCLTENTIGLRSAPKFPVAQSLTMPISRGDPPILE